MKKIRKNTQLSLINPKRAGRKPIHDRGIRHIKRDVIKKPTSLHITIKVRENKADIQNKRILKALHHAIKKARAKSLKVIHYTLEYNHIHMLVESDSHHSLGKAMQAFGISLAKNINKVKALKGTVYKHRYHLRKIATPTELKNVLHYIFSNGVKHKHTHNILDIYNSSIAERHLKRLYPKLTIKFHPRFFNLQMELFKLLEPGRIHFKTLEIQLSKL